MLRKSLKLLKRIYLMGTEVKTDLEDMVKRLDSTESFADYLLVKY